MASTIVFREWSAVLHKDKGVWGVGMYYCADYQAAKSGEQAYVLRFITNSINRLKWLYIDLSSHEYPRHASIVYWNFYLAHAKIDSLKSST